MNIKTYSEQFQLSPKQITQIAQFLYQHLDAYGDDMADVLKAIHYAQSANGSAGGYIITLAKDEDLLGAVVINKTGMEGYIPENILVYIAIHNNHRGSGLGRLLMQRAIDTINGNMALHCEPDNPARWLYEKLGFKSKYMEMRLQKD